MINIVVKSVTFMRLISQSTGDPWMVGRDRQRKRERERI